MASEEKLSRGIGALNGGKRRGRPPRAKASNLSAVYSIRFNQEHLKLIKAAAVLADKEVSAYIREAAVKMAQLSIGKEARASYLKGLKGGVDDFKNFS